MTDNLTNRMKNCIFFFLRRKQVFLSYKIMLGNKMYLLFNSEHCEADETNFKVVMEILIEPVSAWYVQMSSRI